ncbi:MAG: DNA-3-methyladenine glycosylase I [Nitrososphaerota archaeon]|nr:DNA-3-methyladenine glycosylase I [Nitrososphaerota archaeon]MDG6941710.1 DNA-3-methyladenine glycosylase I [Nitrososphaerota archaeon]MDG6947117.1 DNA-3-methyladenine glycosylase I [Nitrososphaerota archaeon]
MVIALQPRRIRIVVGSEKVECTSELDAVVEHVRRCGWPMLDEPLYREYHDKEWGVPLHDDRFLFEFLVLEGAQAGLSWYTILRKRENYRRAFDGFDPKKVAKYDQRKVDRLLSDPGIVRNRLKVNSAVQNAKAFVKVQEEFGSFDDYLGNFVGRRPKTNRWRTLKDVPAVTPEASAMSKDLVSRGFGFVGPTICYAHMQATGMVNDHVTSCFRHKEIAHLLRASPSPSARRRPSSPLTPPEAGGGGGACRSPIPSP